MIPRPIFVHRLSTTSLLSLKQSPRRCFSDRKVQETVSKIQEAFLHKRQVSFSELDYVPNTVEEGFTVQKAVLREIRANHPNIKLVGFKLGATSDKAQKNLSITSPFVGAIFSSRTFPSPCRLPPNLLQHETIKGVEAEFVLHLPGSLNATITNKFSANHQISHEDVEKLVTGVSAGIEVACSRFGVVSTPMLVADLGGNGAMITNHTLPYNDTLRKSLNMAQTVVTMNVFDNEAALMSHRHHHPSHLSSSSSSSLAPPPIRSAQGTGNDVLGHPMKALAWFVNYMRQQQLLHLLSEPVLVSTGTCTGLLPITQGQAASADFGPLLGKVDVLFD